MSNAPESRMHEKQVFSRRENINPSRLLHITSVRARAKQCQFIKISIYLRFLTYKLT
jgi:hypothetical protein